jgi:hypothetical protein
VDLLFDAAIAATSLALFLYWFRYSCLLIFAAEMPHDYREEVARANQLSFLEVQSRLRRHEITDLDRLHQCLERDYAIVTDLLERIPITRSDTGFEDLMLKIHYHGMRACFRVTRRSLHEFASDALEEMSLVVAHMANQLGERSLKPAAR